MGYGKSGRVDAKRREIYVCQRGGGGGFGGSERKKEKKWKEVFKSPFLSSASCHFDSPIPGESGLLPERYIYFFLSFAV